MAIFSGLATLFTGLLGSTFLSSIGGVLLKVAVGVGLSLAAQALAGKPKTPDQLDQPYGVQGTLQSGGDLARSLLVGYAVTAGSLVWHTTWGEVDNTPNALYTQVIATSDFPVSSTQPEVWVGDEKVTVLWGASPIGPGYPVLEYRDSKGVDHLWVKAHDGTQTAADSWLVSLSTTERPYQSTRVGRGVAYVIVTARVNPELFSGFPQYRFAYPSAAKFYDISKDSSAGGSGSQRWADPSTWGGDGDHLPAVQLYNLLRGVSYGGKWLYGLQNLPEARLPAAHWIAQIRKCRTTVTGPSGSEATYRAGGEIKVSANIANTVEALLTTCQGRLTESGGVYKVFVGEPGSSVASFDDGTIISSDEQTFSPFFGLADTVNGITASYPNPAEGWNTQEAPPLYRSDLEALVGDRRLLADVSFDFVPYKGQVQRLMKSALAEAQRARRHTLVLPPEFWALEPGDVVTWTSERNGYDTKLFRVDGVHDKANLDIVVDLTEVDPADYDWDQDTDYRVPVDGPLTKLRPTPQPVKDWFAEGETDAIGGKRRACIRLSWDPNVKDDIDRIRWEVRRAADLVVILRSGTDDVDAGSALISHNVFSNSRYQVRGRYLAYSGRRTTWSDWLEVTTPDVPFTDILVDLEHFNRDIEQLLAERKRAFDDAIAEVLTYNAEVLALKAADIVDRRQFTKQVGRLSASFTQEVALRVSADEALAAFQTTLSTRLGAAETGLSAQGDAIDSLESQTSILDGKVSVNTAAITAANGRITSLEADASALFGAFNTLTGRLAIDEGKIDVNASNISAANAQIATLNGKVAGQGVAVTSLQSQVTQLNGQVAAFSTSLTAVIAKTNAGTASGLIQWVATSSPAGVSARLALAGKASANGVSRMGGFYLDVYPTFSRATFDVRSFQITNGTDTTLPLVFQGGILRVAILRVSSANIDNAAINSAHIKNLSVDTIHIKNGAVSNRKTTPTLRLIGTGVTVGASVTVKVGELAISNPSGATVNLQLSWAYHAYIGGMVSGYPLSGTGTLRVRRLGVVVADIAMSASANQSAPSVTGSNFRYVADFAPAGNITYIVELIVTATGRQGRGSVDVTSAVLKAHWNKV